jgi:hypothetical protein
MKVQITENFKPAIVLERRDLPAAINILDKIRFNSKADEIQRTWVLVQLYCVLRYKP